LQILEQFDQLVTIREEVNWNLEAAAIMRRCNERQGPVPLFENITDYPGYRLTSDLLSTFPRFALALGLQPHSPYGQIVSEYNRRSENAIAPVRVKTGSCKDNIRTGNDVDLFKLPVPMIHEGDGGRYIGTLNVGVVKDPESSWVNWGIYRIMVHDANTAGIFMQPGQHGDSIYQKYEKLNKPMPFAAFIGGDPLVYVGAATGLPYGISEANVVGGLRGQPLELVKCETSDLEVPAESEIIIEGEILPKVRKDEGPFGEYTGYQTRDVFPRPVIRVNTITYRDKPILTVDAEGTPVVMDHIIASVTRSGEIKKALLSDGLPVTEVYIPPDSANHMIIIGVQKTRYPVAFKIAACVWANKSGHHIPHVFVVDEDVDPTNMAEVVHAFSTKCHPKRGITVVENAFVSQLTPFLDPDERKSFRGAFALYDCTWPVNWNPDHIPIRASFKTIYPKEIQERVLSKWKQYGFKD
jgi:4-hydroxy-3-polyprenylbenzoate decarboxylase